MKDYHSKYDNVSPILVIGKTPKGYFFGGYSTVNLSYDKYNNKYEYDNEAFLFSLNQKKKFLSNDKNRTIGFIRGYCIILVMEVIHFKLKMAF